MGHIKWTGEELFIFNGDFVFIVDPLKDDEDNAVLVSSYPSGEPFRVCWDNIDSATPEQLNVIE